MLVMSSWTTSTVWFTRQPQSTNRYIGEKASLICTAEGQPTIQYLWFKMDTQKGKRRHVHTCTDGVLSFEKLASKHWGYYVCQAQNDHEHIESEMVKVSVEPRPSGSAEKGLLGQWTLFMHYDAVGVNCRH